MAVRKFELKWEDSFDPIYGKALIIPVDTILWRGYDQAYPSVSDRYAFYGSKQTATGYANLTGRKLGCFITTQYLRVIDYRFLRVLLSRLINTNASNAHVNTFAPLMISFGLSSLRHQITLLKQRYNDLLATSPPTSDSIHMQNAIKEVESVYDPSAIIEQSGFRIAETINDGYSMTFLQELFRDTIDGIISPRLYSPFHIEKSKYNSPEIILFNPKACGIHELSVPPSIIESITIRQLIYYVGAQLLTLSSKTHPDVTLKFYMMSGGGSKGRTDTFDELIHKDDKTAIKIYNKAKRDGAKWRYKHGIYDIEPPSPSVAVSPFPLHLETGV